MAVWRTLDRGAGALAAAASTLGQLALVALGVHLAADRLDDRFYQGLTAATELLELWLSEPLGSFAGAVGLAPGQLMFWEWVPLVPVAAGSALLLELITLALMGGSFVLTARAPAPTWQRWWRARSVHAFVLPVVLLGVLAAGSWSLAMAAEDLLPPSTLAPYAAAGLALAAFGRFGVPAWLRAVDTLDPTDDRTRGIWTSLLVLPLGALAWRHGLPIWGWLL